MHEQDDISTHFEERQDGTAATMRGRSSDRSFDVYLLYRTLFTWPLWVALSTHFLLSSSLVVSALYK